MLDIDDTFDAVHGGQQLRLFNAHYDEYGFQPIVVFDGEGRPVAAVLRPAKRPSGRETRAFLRRLMRAIRGHWPRVEILLRADSHYCAPEVLDFCRAEGLDFMLGVAPTTTLRRHVEALERSTAAQRTGTGKLRRYKEFHDGAASWSRVERIIARVEAGPDGTDTRFIVTNLAGGAGAPSLREELLRARTGREPYQGLEAAPRRRPHLVLARHRQPVPPDAAHRRLLADVVAARLMPKRSSWRVAQFDTLRLRLLKIAARVVALKTRVMLHLPSACPYQSVLRLALGRMPRLIS